MSHTEYPISEHLRRRVVEASRELAKREWDPEVEWRYAQLLRAGADEHYAQVIAERTDLSLHRLLELMECGCPPVTAMAILA